MTDAPVSQAAREAAASVAAMMIGADSKEWKAKPTYRRADACFARYCSGINDDDALVQAFARFEAAIRADAREVCMKIVCSGCENGDPVNDAGYHQRRTWTYPCHVAAIRERGPNAQQE